MEFFFWFVLFLWIIVVKIKKIKFDVSVKTSGIFFLIGVFFYIIGLQNIGEIFFRISLVGVLIGVGQSVIEYKIT